jgi:hypothetical protein
MSFSHVSQRTKPGRLRAEIAQPGGDYKGATYQNYFPWAIMAPKMIKSCSNRTHFRAFGAEKAVS